MEDYRFQVATAYNQLIAEKFPLLSTTEEEIEKARLTRRAAWLIHQVNSNIGLLEKTTGNNVLGLSVDIVIDKTNGEFVDIASSRSLGNGQVEIIPVWVPKMDTLLIPRWVKPTAELANMEPGNPPDEPGNGEPDQTTIQIEIQKLHLKLDKILQSQTDLINVAIKFVEKFK